MKNMVELEMVNDYCKGLGLSASHPLVTVVDLSKADWKPRKGTRSVRYHFYGIFLKQGQQCIMQYGRQNYDFQDGTLVFVGPGQIVNIEHIETDYQPTGFALLFHPDLLLGTQLGKVIDSHSFFSYELHEALHISERERQIVLDCFSKIEFELQQGMDRHSRKLVTSNIELFLNYCHRFYDRQFFTREHKNQGVVGKFEKLLNGYFNSDKPREIGLPTVAYFAGELHLSPNYFGDLIKKETGKSAKDLIQDKLIETAKARTFDTDKSVSEIAFDLGFKYPQHFSRLFKKNVGYTPNEYRMLN